jgi:hypothetical protein
MSAHSSPGPRGTATPILEHQTSLDTLADRLGLMDVQDKPKRHAQPPRPRPRPAPAPKPKKNQSSLQLCCFSIPLEEESAPPARPQPRPVQRPAASSVPSPARKSKQQLSAEHSSRLTPAATSPGKRSNRSRKSNASQTAQLMDLIPDTLDTLTASALLSELARPFVGSEEPGFIYMFWLTPASSSPPPVDAARSLLAPPTASRSRRPSDVVSQFANQKSGTSRKTMMLKIGRAANVHRRMNQWQKQCGYDIEVLRFYPYVPGASDASSGAVPHMTPHCHRVERLVHIELSGMGLRKTMDSCKTCGRDHREWFEVDATRDGIRQVDDVIRRWIEWDESQV